MVSILQQPLRAIESVRVIRRQTLQHKLELIDPGFELFRCLPILAGRLYKSTIIAT